MLTVTTTLLGSVVLTGCAASTSASSLPAVTSPGGPGPYEVINDGETPTVLDVAGAGEGLATLPVGKTAGGCGGGEGPYLVNFSDGTSITVYGMNCRGAKAQAKMQAPPGARMIEFFPI